jgi:hypothetical protein
MRSGERLQCHLFALACRIEQARGLWCAQRHHKCRVHARRRVVEGAQLDGSGHVEEESRAEWKV